MARRTVVVRQEEEEDWPTRMCQVQKSDEEWRHEQSGAKWSGATQRKARAKAGELNAASSYTRGAGRQVQSQLSSAQPLNSALQLKQAKRPQTTALESHNTQGMTQMYYGIIVP